MSNGALFPCLLRYRCMSKENKIATRRFTIINTTILINICKTMQGKWRSTSNMKTKGNRTLKITQNMFNGSSICIYKSMHPLTICVNSKKNAWSCKSEILKRTNNLSKTYKVRKQTIRHFINLWYRNKSIIRPARRHTCPVKNVKNILISL